MAEYIREIRSLVGTRQLLLPTTACIILNEEEEVLLQLRSDLHAWGCPGGIMDIGETAVESVTREVLEETGLVIVKPWLFGVYSGEGYEGVYPNGDEIAVVQMAFVAEEFSGDLRHDEESLELRYFSLLSLPDPLAPHHRPILLHYREYLAGRRTAPVVL